MNKAIGIKDKNKLLMFIFLIFFNQISVADIFNVSGTTGKTSVSVLDENSFALSYFNETVSNGYFYIFKKDGTIVVNRTRFGQSVNYAYALKSSAFSANYFSISWSSPLKFAVWNSIGGIYTSETAIDTEGASYVDSDALDTNAIVFVKGGTSAGGQGFFDIFDINGELKNETNFLSANCLGVSVTTLDENTFVVIYKLNTSPYNGFKVYDKNGSLIATKESIGLSSSFESATLDSNTFVILNSGSIQIYDRNTDLLYSNSTQGGQVIADLNSNYFVVVDNNKFIVFKRDATIVSTTSFSSSSISSPSIASFDNKTIVISFVDYGGNRYGKFVVYDINGTLISQTPPTLSGFTIEPQYAKNGETLTLSVELPEDGENNDLNLYCATTPSASSTNNDFCESLNNKVPYSISCNANAGNDDLNHQIYCRLYDGKEYSIEKTNWYFNDVEPIVKLVTPSTDGNYLSGLQGIVFDVNDADLQSNNDGNLWIDIYYSSTQNSFQNVIVSDGNLFDSSLFSCTDTNFSTTQTCTYSWDTTAIADGNYYIDLNVFDDAKLNSIKYSDYDFMVDNTNPITTDNAPSGWQTSDFSITLSCSDANSGCDTTYYSVDGSAFVSGNTVNITTDGNHGVSYYSVDVAGNIETTHDINAPLDKTAPTYSLGSPDSNKANQSVSQFTFAVKLSDATSGARRCFWTTFKNGTVQDSGVVDVNSDGYCEKTVSGMSNDDVWFVRWIGNDYADNNASSIDSNSYEYDTTPDDGGSSSGGGGGSVTVLPGGLGGVGSFCQNDLDCSAGLYCDDNAGVCVRDSPIAETIVDYSWSDSVKLVSSDSNSEFSVVLVNKTSKDLPLVASVDSNLSRYLSLVSDVNSLPAFGVRRIAWRVFVDGNFSGARGNVVVVVGSGRAVLSHVLELKPSVGLGALWGYRLFEFSQPLPFVGRVLTLGFGVFVVVVVVVLWWVYKRG